VQQQRALLSPLEQNAGGSDGEKYEGDVKPHNSHSRSSKDDLPLGAKADARTCDDLKTAPQAMPQLAQHSPFQKGAELEADVKKGVREPS
jgi:hypothetical protein